MFFGTFWEHHTCLYIYHALIIKYLNTILCYSEDITKYAQGLNKGKIKNVYDHISVFLGQDNKKFQIGKIAHGARNREYVGTVEWLRDAGIVNVCYCPRLTR